MSVYNCDIVHYILRHVMDHYEYYDSLGNFIVSGDTEGEAYENLLDWFEERAHKIA
jgi:hypothetical protein